jgi:hypothetical protein
MAGKPFCLKLTRLDGAAHDDFECAFAEADGRDLIDGQGERFVKEAVEVVDMPVEFFLEGDHAEEERVCAFTSRVER